MKINLLQWLLILVVLSSCNTLKPYYGKEYRDWESNELPDSSLLMHTVYLVGDGGAMKKDDNILQSLRDHLMSEPDSASSLVYLGDNIYLHGLPPESSDDREEKEEILRAQMDVAAGYEGNVIFVPGNHDWDYSGPDGLAYALRQEQYVEHYFDDANVFRPDNGCAGPEVIDVNPSLVIIALNTEWWIHPFYVPRAPENGCSVEDKVDMMIQLDDVIRNNEDKHILIVAHHPIISNGNHGGHYNLIDHIFPLRLVRDNLYIPLPLIGSLYPLLRKAGVSPQDIPNTEFQRFKEGLLSIIENRSNIIYATGHDHNLQLNKQGNMHHIISGSASKINFAIEGFGAAYVHQQIGYCRVKYYSDGQSWVEFFYVTNDDPVGKLAFRTPLYALDSAELTDRDISVPDYTDSVRTIAANPDYKKSTLGRFFMGDHYREEWITPVEVPYIDLKTFSGGLKPVRKGGGKQTITIHLVDPDDTQYVLRSIDKFPSEALPESFRDTWLNNFVKDQTSTGHPYGALMIPPMADKIGIYHTSPQLFYTPVTPTLGSYMGDFGGRLGMIEIRPDKDLRGYSRFGNAKNIVSTHTMLEQLRDDNDNVVDEEMYLRARLFDMLIGDWDRHYNQWRWAEYEKEKGAVYRPVPRNRDQVFARYDGVIPWLLTRKWAYRNLSHFSDTIRDVTGLNQSARTLDRRLLASLSRDKWIDIAQDIQMRLTDEVIDSAMNRVPPEIYQYSGKEIARQIKARRNDLQFYATRFYEDLSEIVSIAGSEKHEYFEVERINDKQTSVKIYNLKKEEGKQQVLYDRIFDTDVTRELRLYGMDGQDVFEVSGNTDRGLTIRVLGGRGMDTINISSRVGHWGKQTYVYDQPINEGFISVNKDTRIYLDEEVGSYEADTELDYSNYIGPLVSAEFNEDDGWLLGGGITLRKPGFRKQPAGYEITARGAYATQTGAFNAALSGAFYSFLGKKNDLLIDLGYYGPDYVFNYFGSGDNTENSETIDYYRIKMESIHLTPTFQWRLTEILALGAFLDYSHINIREPGEINSILNTVDRDDPFFSTSPVSLGQAGVFATIRLLDREFRPEKGFILNARASWNEDFSEDYAEFFRYSANLSVYLTPNLPLRTTFASRVGFDATDGDYYFYQSSFLGGLSNLRGYRRTRFAGQSSFYNNNEVRVNLLTLRDDLVSGSLGILGFFDLGRVWNDDGTSGELRTGYGPGVYVQLLNKFIWSATCGFSDEDTYFSFKTGFFF